VEDGGEFDGGETVGVIIEHRESKKN